MKTNESNPILYCNHWKRTVDFYSMDLNLTVLTVREWFVEFRLTDSARLSIADTARTLIKSSKGKGVTISLKVDVMISRQDILILREKKWTPPRFAPCGVQGSFISTIPRVTDSNFGHHRFYGRFQPFRGSHWHRRHALRALIRSGTCHCGRCADRSTGDAEVGWVLISPLN